ncbi:MAG: 6-phosphogluconolactonase [Anaerolineae bacterium]|nr:6-phosphogluconolactonase [Anaerolineae bacterium]
MSAHGQQPDIVVLPDPAGVAEEAARRFVTLAMQAIEARGRFTVALAGGSTPVALYGLLSRPPYREQIPWERTLLFFGDERCVPPDHPWSNYRMAREALLDRVPVPAQNIYRMAGELSPETAAVSYAASLRRAFHLRGAARPRFDLILLGMGEDGHTASLFPGMPALQERRRLVVATQVPEYVKPSVARITLTLPVLNAAHQVMFLVTGAGKAKVARIILEDQLIESICEGGVRRGRRDPGRQAFPASRVQPVHGTLSWLLDRAAAGLA